MMVRNILNRVSREVVLKKTLPARAGGGPVFTSPDAMLSMWKPGLRSDQAQQLFDWCERWVQPGDVVWDVGANQGFFALAAAHAAGPSGEVTAFEPDPFLAGLILRTLGARGDRQDREAPLRLSTSAIADCAGECELQIAASDRALNHLRSADGNPRTGGVRAAVLVATTTLDRCAEGHRAPDLIKVDIEGGELSALAGAEHVLSEVRPRFIIEVAPENCASATEIFLSHDYLLMDAENAAEHEPLERCAWNTLAVPAELGAPLLS